jgi:hypothetical protein
MVVLGDVGLGISLGAVFSFMGSRARDFCLARACDLTLCEPATRMHARGFQAGGCILILFVYDSMF